MITQTYFEKIAQRSVNGQDPGLAKYVCQNPKCGSKIVPLVTVSQTFGEVKVHPAFCKGCRRAQIEELGEEKKIEQWRESRGLMYGLQNMIHHHAGRTPFLEDIGFTDVQTPAADYLKKIASGEKKGVLITGSVGTGKSLLAKALNNSLMRRYQHAVFVKSVDLAIRMRKETWGQNYRELIESFQRVPILIIDDFGSHKHNDWIAEALFSILDSRYENEKTTIVTSNIPKDDLKNFDNRLASRILAESWMKGFQLVGKDLRMATVNSIFDKK